MSKILFLGDFFYDYNIIQDDINEISKWIRMNDYKVILNLETSLVKTDNPIKKRGLNISSSSITVDVLKKLNVLGVTLANNHFMDFGDEGAKESIKLLDEAGIKHVGAGRNLEESIKELCFQMDSKEIIIQNFGWNVEETKYATEKNWGCSPLDRRKILENTKVLKIKHPHALLINVYHWGFEFNELPMPIDIKLAHDSIANGCDLVIGHHPHVIQPYEIYNEKNIYYSLGNFYFSSMREKYFQDLIKYKCDLGLGIIFDTDTNECNCIGINYNRITKKTVIMEIEVNSLTGIDYTTNEYYTKVKNAAGKPNPILDLNDKKNDKRIKRLFVKYWIANKIAFIKKTKIGLSVYNVLKKMVR